jgi:hypothetical protein
MSNECANDKKSAIQAEPEKIAAETVFSASFFLKPRQAFWKMRVSQCG